MKACSRAGAVPTAQREAPAERRGRGGAGGAGERLQPGRGVLPRHLGPADGPPGGAGAAVFTQQKPPDVQPLKLPVDGERAGWPSLSSVRTSLTWSPSRHVTVTGASPPGPSPCPVWRAVPRPFLAGLRLQPAAKTAGEPSGPVGAAGSVPSGLLGRATPSPRLTGCSRLDGAWRLSVQPPPLPGARWPWIDLPCGVRPGAVSSRKRTRQPERFVF